MHEERLDVEGLHLWRGDRHVLRGVGFSLSGGECLQVTGPNGSGKTSLLRTVCGLMYPEAGRVLWEGRDVRSDLRTFHGALAYLGHEPPLKADLSARENLRYWIGVRHRVGTAALEDVLERVGASSWCERLVRTLSAGQRARSAAPGARGMSRYGSPVAGVVVPAAPTPAQATVWAGSHQAPILDAARLALARDLQLAFRKRGQLVQPLAFFAMVTMLFPLAISPELARLREIAPGVLWAGALLASLLALEFLFRDDAYDGTLEQYALSGQSLTWLIFAKTAAHWLLTGLPLALMAPLAGLSPRSRWAVWR